MNELGDPAGYRLAYEAELKANEEQAASLREIRDRTGTLLSIALLTGGLVAGLATIGTGSPVLGDTGFAGGVLVGTAILSIAIITISVWRPAEVSFSIDGAVIIGSYLEGEQALQEAELHRELALHLNDNGQTNRIVLSTTLRSFRTGLVMMLLEILGVALMLWDIANG